MEVDTRDTIHSSGIWSFVVDSIEITAPLPYEIAPGCVIAKADPEMVAKLKNVFDSISGFALTRPQYFYEFETTVQETDSGSKIDIQPVPEDQWRYYVVKTPDDGLKNRDLHLTSKISEVPLNLTTLRFHSTGTAFDVNGLQRLYHFGPIAPPTKFTETALNDWSEAYCDWTRITNGSTGKTEFPELRRALEMYDNLNSLPEYSEFHILGLFAIIEMLITHNPKLEDRGDSITHQMQSKIPLLSRRFHKPLDVASFFGNASTKKIWSALYAYRSSLAHGGLPDFEAGELRILKNQLHAKSFLSAVVKSMIRHALKEPHLYHDLRAC